MSEPANAMFCPGPTARATLIPPASSGSVCSIITTASAPRGIGAPVATDVAVPDVTVIVGAMPQCTISPVSTSRTGVPADAFPRSPAATAKPSTTDRSNGGASTGAVTSSASTRPSRRSSGARSIPSGAGLSAPRNVAIASSRDITFRNCSCAIPLTFGGDVMKSTLVGSSRKDRRVRSQRLPRWRRGLLSLTA